MNNRIIITFNSNPLNFHGLWFLVTEDTAPPGSLDFMFTRVFVTGIPTSTGQVRIGDTLEETLDNLYANFISTNPIIGSGINFVNRSFEGIIEIVFPLADYTPTINPLNTADITVGTDVTIPPVVIPALDPLVIEDFSISIIDTYVNSLPLIVEFAAEGACKIDWNGDDDLLKEIMPSKLSFNMLVPDKSDAHFIHLFTGDENRYRVELNAIDVSNNNQLVWQGFLLPDQYKEPYTNSVLFVDFTATDNIGSLKGKYFEPWYYYNKFPLTELLAMILKKTGLNQSLLIRPSLIPSFARVNWWYINVDLKPYYNGKKFDDVYKILNDVLKANLLTLKNYRGYWFLEGFTRKKDQVGVMLQFDTDGKYVGEMDFEKTRVESLISDGSPVLSAITPFRKVNFNVDVKGDKNMFPDTVAVLPEKDIFYNYYGPVLVNQSLLYSDQRFRDWDFNFNANFIYNFFKDNNANYRVGNWLVNGQYHYTEAMALSNYIECKDTAYVKPGILYVFDVEFFANGISSADNGISSLALDKLIPFQVFLNGVEIISNRPSFDSSGRYSYVVTNSNYQGYASGSTFKLRFEFRVEIPGYINFRVLVPIAEILYWSRIYVQKLKLEIVEDYNITEDLTGVRNINFTQELDYDVAYTCTQDKSVDNSLGLGLPIDPDYFVTLYEADAPWFAFTTYNLFLPATTLSLDFLGFEINDMLYQLLFVEGWRRACYLEKSTGDKIPFDNLYGSYSSATTKKAAFLLEHDGYPVLPKHYFAYPDFVESDSIILMYVRYSFEDYNQRLSWKIFGSAIEDEFKKVLISALHNLNPNGLYRLECELLQMLFPDDLLSFYFDDGPRDFIPTRLTIDLFAGKTSVVATEAKYEELTDIIFE